MILIGENRSTWREIRPSACCSTANHKCTELGCTQVLRGDRPTTDPLRHGMALLKRWAILTHK